jgi:hypothetical protein
MNITPWGHDQYKLQIRDVQDHVFCPGEPVRAQGRGVLTDPLHMTADFRYFCPMSGAKGEMTLYFALYTKNPNGIYEITETPGTGRVWTRPK